MNFQKTSFFLILFSILTLCCKSIEDPTPDTTTTGTSTSTSTSTSTGTSTPPTALAQMEASSDYTADASTPNVIKLNGGSIAVSGSGATASGSKVTITAAGTYSISGNLTNGQIIVKTDATDPVKLILNGIDVANSSTSPIFIDKAKKVILFLANGSTNKVSDGGTYTDVAEGQNAAIYSQAYMAITGEGTLNVTGNFEDAIASKDGLLINSGSYKITAKDDAIRGKDYLVVRDGKFDITTTAGDAMKSDYESDTNFGYVLIDKGTFKINAKEDAISAHTTLTVKAGTFDITTGGGSSQASGTVSAKAFKANNLVRLAVTSVKINAADDGVNSDKQVIIEKGIFTISTADDGIHANETVTIQDGDITITKCFEGVEAKTINIEKGFVSVVSSNDCINATAGTDAQQNDGSFIYIKGGTLVLDGQGGDPLDSNGNISMTDGTVIIHGPAGMEVPIDYNGTFVVSKGTIIASGSNSRMLQAPSTTSTVNSLKLLFNTANAANTLSYITDDAGVVIASFNPIKTYASLVLTSEKLVKDKKYNVYTGGSISGNHVGGYYAAGTPTGGTLRGSFTVSSSVNNVTL